MNNRDIDSNGSGRAQREAEIAKMIQSLDEAPALPKPSVKGPLVTETNNTVSAIPASTTPSDTTSNTEEITKKKKKKKKSIVKKMKIPITSRITLPYLSAVSSSDKSSSSTVITTLGLDPSGSRLISGCTDSYVRMYDFGGMDLTGSRWSWYKTRLF